MSPMLSEYGYRLVVVYASVTHWTPPATSTGYGSASYDRNGASFWRRSSMSRTHSIWLSLLMAPDSNTLRSRNASANDERRTNELISTPSSPSYSLGSSSHAFSTDSVFVMANEPTSGLK